MKKIFTISLFACLLVINIVCTKPATDTPLPDTKTAETEQLATGKIQTFVIKKGDHYSSPNPLTFTSKSQLAFDALFDSSCIYQTTDPLNQEDINKLYGFSDCNSQHLENSARVGWRWSDDSLRIFGYVHNGGVMMFQEITTAPIGSVIACRITCLADQYEFDVNGKTVFLPRHCSGRYSRYRLYPYFGGDETAPHDIRIQVMEQRN
jgi:hypothetical protein